MPFPTTPEQYETRQRDAFDRVRAMYAAVIAHATRIETPTTGFMARGEMPCPEEDCTGTVQYEGTLVLWPPANSARLSPTYIVCDTEDPACRYKQSGGDVWVGANVIHGLFIGGSFPLDPSQPVAHSAYGWTPEEMAASTAEWQAVADRAKAAEAAHLAALGLPAEPPEDHADVAALRLVRGAIAELLTEAPFTPDEDMDPAEVEGMEAETRAMITALTRSYEWFLENDSDFRAGYHRMWLDVGHQREEAEARATRAEQALRAIWEADQRAGDHLEFRTAALTALDTFNRETPA